MNAVERFTNEKDDQPVVRGFLHRPENAARASLVLTHGAGSNANAPLLVAVAEAFAGAGIMVLRCDLPFRQLRSGGPPRGNGAADRAGLQRAVEVLRELGPQRVFLGGHSYGGRQGSMLAAENPAVAEGLLLLSYPLHPPERPQQLRTAHFPDLRIPALFVHGSRDPFGSLEEMRAALGSITGSVELLAVEGAGHDLSRGGYPGVANRVLSAFLELVEPTRQAL